MTTRFYHLAEVNIARALAPLEDPIMRGFVSRLETINAIADQSAGFVWRMQSDTGDNTYLRPYEDPLIIFNLSVWESIDALKSYVYRSEHSVSVRDRKRWFERMDARHFALWWIPAGHIPSVEEAKRRLRYLQDHGESPLAFSFVRTFEMPEEPESGFADEHLLSSAANYDGKVFALRSRSDLGDCGRKTLFHYRQEGSRVWASYEGDGVRFGSLVAVSDSMGRLTGCYQHLTAENEVRSGRYEGIPQRLANSRLRIIEDWHANSGRGRSVLEEAD